MAVGNRDVLLLVWAASIVLGGVLFWKEAVPSFRQTVAGFVVLVFAVLACAAYDLHRRLPGNTTYSWPDIIRLYLFKASTEILGTIWYHSLERRTRRCQETQAKVLMELLQKNANTQYGRLCKFLEITTTDEFRRQCPLTRHTNMKPHIDRLLKGEPNVLTADDVIYMAATSGTTGNRNFLPMTSRCRRASLRMMAIVFGYVMRSYFPRSLGVRKTARCFYAAAEQKTEGGLPLGPYTAGLGVTKPSPMVALPASAYGIYAREALCYVNLVFSLKDRTINSISGSYINTIYFYFVYLSRHWAEIVDDIERGTISVRDLDPELRAALRALLAPDPERASELRAQFQKGFCGIAGRIWPECCLVVAISGGFAQLYGDILRDSYCHGMDFYSPIYACTESMQAINLWPRNPRLEYLPLLDDIFLEFIPIDQLDAEHPQTLFMHEVQLNEEYELVVTTYTGLIRYRMGDVIRVSRLHNECPVFEFCYRTGQLMDIAGERTSETVMYDVVTRLVSDWPDARLVDYTCTLSVIMDQVTGHPQADCGYYIIFLEVAMEKGDFRDKATTLETTVDDYIRQAAPPYDKCRARGILGPAHLHIVKPGCFVELRDYIMDNLTLTNINQFKMPRFLNRKNVVEQIVTSMKD